jgi:uncharacterized protein
MLLEFTVENYRSIKGPVTLSAVAQKAPKRKASAKTKRGVKSDAEICPGFEVEGWDLTLLPVMAIFGANASGKSNVLEALSDFTQFIVHKHLERETQLSSVAQITRYKPFGLDEIYQSRPSIFTLKIVAQSRIYEYCLALNQQQILSESLEYSPSDSKRSRLIFSRRWQNDSYVWKIGSGIPRSQLQLGQTIGRNEIFLDILARFEIDVVKPLWVVLRYAMLIKPVILKELNDAAAELIHASLTSLPEIGNDVMNLLKEFDTGLQNLEIYRDSSSNDIKIYAIHKTAQNQLIRWDFREESLGTQRLFSFAFFIKVVLGAGGLVLVDELGTNLHPKITAYIIQLFQNPKTNPKGAQLIFTSHDNTLQRNQLLRRDQIWFTEKKPDQSTDLYSLADFKVRNDLAIDKAYLDGRFGAVPFLPDTVEELLGVE